MTEDRTHLPTCDRKAAGARGAHVRDHCADVSAHEKGSTPRMSYSTELRAGQRMLTRSWKAAAARGALATAFAVSILVWPGIGLGALVALFGAFSLVTGVARLVEALTFPGGRRRVGWLLLDGLVGIGVGVAVFVWPELSALGLLYAIAFWAIMSGVLQLVLAFVPPLRGQSLLTALGALVSIAFGVIMMWHPGTGAVALLALVAAYACVTGVLQIAWALDLRRLSRDLGAGLDVQTEEAHADRAAGPTQPEPATP